jgi:hypothetical protein
MANDIPPRKPKKNPEPKIKNKKYTQNTPLTPKIPKSTIHNNTETEG